LLNPTAVIPPTAATENLPDQNAAWREATRICRRICVLREQGKQAEAEAMMAHELAGVRMILLGVGDVSAVETRMAAIFAREEERVADATVLAELLAPTLCAALAASTRSGGAVKTSTLSSHLPAPKQIVARGGTGDIADFIDEMLAQDRAPESRRAS
jgi:hypothetical protein